MPYNAIDVARYIISCCSSKDRPLSNLKLQKVLYFAWVDYLEAVGRYLFLDDICAWKLGPVVPDVYYEFCPYGGRPIDLAYDVAERFLNDDRAILDGMIDHYIDIPASTLVNMTHQDGTAWDCIFRNGAGNRNIIPFSLIEDQENRRQGTLGRASFLHAYKGG